MTVFQSILLGIVQGLTEFLPISSSGHLIIFQSLLKLSDTSRYLLFDIVLHVGTLISICIVFWKDIKSITVEFFKLLIGCFDKNSRKNIKSDIKSMNNSKKLLYLLVVATVPLIFVVFIKKYVDALFSSLLLVGFMLILTSIILFLTDKLIDSRKNFSNMSYLDALITGIFQLFAVIPGISRSGSTIFGAVLCGLKREIAVKFSMLMSIMAVLGALVGTIKDLFSSSANTLIAYVPITSYLTGFLVSAITGVFAIRFLIKLISNRKLKYFAVYCLIVGIVVIIFHN